MKKSKKLRNLVAVVSILSIVFAAQNFITAMADCADSNWSLNGGNAINTNYRYKETSSSVYLNVTDWRGDPWIHNEINVKVVEANYKPLKRNFTKQVSGNGTYAITNWAYEENNAPINIRLAIWDSVIPRRSYNGTFNCGGQWSPDYCN